MYQNYSTTELVEPWYRQNATIEDPRRTDLTTIEIQNDVSAELRKRGVSDHEIEQIAREQELIA